MRVAATRRDFLMTGGAAAAAMILPLGGAEAMPLGIPPGLQLWTVKDELAEDFTGTLRALKRIGYARVEAAGYFGRSAADFRSAVPRRARSLTESPGGLRSPRRCGSRTGGQMPRR